MAKKDYSSAMDRAYQSRSDLNEPSVTPEQEEQNTGDAKISEEDQDVVKKQSTRERIYTIENTTLTIVKRPSRKRGKARTLYINDEIYDKLKNVAAEANTSISEIITDILYQILV